MKKYSPHKRGLCCTYSFYYSFSSSGYAGSFSDVQVTSARYISSSAYYSFDNSMPNEYDAVVYYQIRAQLSESYQNSYRYASGKQGLSPLYVYFPSTTYGEELGTVRTPPLGDVNIGIN